MSAQLTIYVLCLLTVLSQASAQGTPNFEKLLDIIFAGNTTVNVKPNTPPISPIGTSPPIGKTCGFGKECVPRKLCNEDGTVNRFGTFMLNLRIDGPCAYLETCCDVSEKVSGYFTNSTYVCMYLCKIKCLAVTGAETRKRNVKWLWLSEFQWCVIQNIWRTKQ